MVLWSVQPSFSPAPLSWPYTSAIVAFPFDVLIRNTIRVTAACRIIQDNHFYGIPLLQILLSSSLYSLQSSDRFLDLSIQVKPKILVNPPKQTGKNALAYRFVRMKISRIALPPNSQRIWRLRLIGQTLMMTSSWLTHFQNPRKVFF